jgi:hypothetical protein
MLRTTGLLFMLVLMLCACATLPPADREVTGEQLQPGDAGEIKPGERLRIKTRDGAEQVLVVLAADEHAIRGYRAAGTAEPVQAGMDAEAPVSTIAIGEISRIEVVAGGAGTKPVTADDLLFLILLGVAMIVATFATF